jgi:hypothetical protein
MQQSIKPQAPDSPQTVWLPAFSPMWFSAMGIVLLTVASCLPWMYLESATFAGQSPFQRSVGGLMESPLWPLLVIAAILLTLFQFRYRWLLILLLTIAFAINAWFQYSALQAWLHLNELEQSLAIKQPAPTASVGIGWYLSIAGLALTLLSILIHRRARDR